MTAREFLACGASDEFRAACARVRLKINGATGPLEPSARQVRRWRRKEGLAWKKGRAS